MTGPFSSYSVWKVMPSKHPSE